MNISSLKKVLDIITIKQTGIKKLAFKTKEANMTPNNYLKCNHYIGTIMMSDGKTAAWSHLPVKVSCEVGRKRSDPPSCYGSPLIKS